jgi:hypothetical protein
VVALVAPDQAGGLGIDLIEPARDGVDALLVIARPRLLTEQLGDPVDDRRAILALALISIDRAQFALSEALQREAMSSALCSS